MNACIKRERAMPNPLPTEEIEKKCGEEEEKKEESSKSNYLKYTLVLAFILLSYVVYKGTKITGAVTGAPLQQMPSIFSTILFIIWALMVVGVFVVVREDLGKERVK